MIPLAEVEAKLRAAIAQVIADGWKLKRKVTLNPQSRCCCILGAYALANRVPFGDNENSAFDPIARHLGIELCGLLIMGFDAQKVSLAPGCDPLYSLGARLAKEFVSEDT